MAMQQVKGRRGMWSYKPRGDGRFECYANECFEIANGTWHSHSGASYHACDAHSGVCHERCWPQYEVVNGLPKEAV